MFSKAKNTVKNGAGGASSTIPPYFLCPLMNEIMDDPTITQCGHMFEREAIVNYLEEVTALP